MANENTYSKLFSKLEAIEMAGGYLQSFGITGGGAMGHTGNQKFICGIVYGQRAFTKWSSTRKMALELAISEVYFQHGQEITNHQNNQKNGISA